MSDALTKATSLRSLVVGRRGNLVGVYVSYDPDAKATYVEWAEGVVASTVSLSDAVMVDLDAEGQPLGVEFAVSPRAVTELMLKTVAGAFPQLDELLRKDWRLEYS